MIPLGVLAHPRATAGPSIVLADSFNRAYGPLVGTQADTGQTWVGPNARVEIVAPGAVTSTTSGDNYANVDAGVSDFIARATYTRSGGIGGLAVRTPVASTFRDCLIARISSSAVALSLKGPSGPLQELASVRRSTSATAHPVEVRCSGPDIEIWIDGGLVLAHTTATYQAQTGVGFYSFNATAGSLWDDLTVEGLS